MVRTPGWVAVWMLVFFATQSALASDYCQKMPTEIAKARCNAVSESRNIPQDIARAEAARTHISWVYDTSISPDGTMLASAGRDQTVKLWDFASGAFIRNLGQHDGFVRRVAFSPNGKIVYSLADNEGLKALDVATGKELNHRDPEPDKLAWYRLAVSADGRYLAIAGDAKYVVLWDTANWREKQRFPVKDAYGLAFLPKGSVLVLSADAAVSLIDAATGKTVGKVPTTLSAENFAFSPDGERLALSADSEVEVWDMVAIKRLQHWTTKMIPSVFQLAITPDKATVVTGTDVPESWRADTGQKVGVFGSFTDLTHSVAISKDGRFAVTGHMGSDIRVWDIASRQLVRRFGEAVEQPN